MLTLHEQYIQSVIVILKYTLQTKGCNVMFRLT